MVPPRRAFLLIIVLAGCASGPGKGPPPPPPVQPGEPAKPSYPAAWFAPLSSDVKAYSWEITPDSARPGEVVLSKRNELGRLLSNFGATPFELDERRYASLEGFWQAMYFPDGPDDPRQAAGPWPVSREQMEQLTGFDAKRPGDEAKKRLKAAGIAWVSYRGHRFDPHGSAEDREYHLELIERATRAKVDQNPDVKRVLLATGDLVLKPDHLQTEDATPAWHYFDILMAIRSDLRKNP